MHHLVIGEGQIGRAIIHQAEARGDDVTVIRRSPSPGAGAGAEPRIRRISADVNDLAALRRAAEGADAVHACFHAAYDARVWASELPGREQNVMTIAAERSIPAIFPESTYAWAANARSLREGSDYAPCDDKGRVRVSLLKARREHEARTVSIVAADLIGPTSLGTGASVACATVLEPIVKGRQPVVLANPALPHSLTFTPDLAAAMIFAAENAHGIGSSADTVWHAPTAPARSLFDLAAEVARTSGRRFRQPLAIPRAALRAASPLHRMIRELSDISELWYQPHEIENGYLTHEAGLAPTDWAEAVDLTVREAMGR